MIAKAVALSLNPARYIAILTYITPDPDYNTLPIITSSIMLGFNLALSQAFFNRGATIYSTAVSLKPPFFDLVKAVLTAAQITTSFGLFGDPLV